MLDREKGVGLITRYGSQLEQVAQVVTVATDLPWPPIPDFKSRYPIAFGWKVRNQELDIDTMFGMGFSPRSVDEVTVRLGYKMTNSHPKPAIIYEGSKLFITKGRGLQRIINPCI